MARHCEGADFLPNSIIRLSCFNHSVCIEPLGAPTMYLNAEERQPFLDSLRAPCLHPWSPIELLPVH